MGLHMQLHLFYWVGGGGGGGWQLLIHTLKLRRLLTKITIEVRASISHHISKFYLDLITRPRYIFRGGIINPRLQKKSLVVNTASFATDSYFVEKIIMARREP